MVEATDRSAAGLPTKGERHGKITQAMPAVISKLMQATVQETS